MSFWRELKRRHVVRVGIAYLAAIWMLIQVADTTFPTFGAPAWAMEALIYASVLGFPFALILAWVYDWTPEGIKLTTEAQASDPPRPASRSFTIGVIAMMSLAIVVLVVDNYVLDDAAPPPDKSIAVLPFANLSDDAEQEYFSDGLTEELLNKLAQVEDLQVAGRTSSFYFKDRDDDLREIGNTLSVDHLLQGSVRRSGNRLRISAQLVNAANGFQLWSDSYERELADIFAIQDEIADAVTTALSITLGAGQFSRQGMTQNVRAYDAYLRSRSGDLLERIDNAERAVSIDPNFSAAWLSLLEALTAGSVFLPPDSTTGFDERIAEADERLRSLPADTPDLLVHEAGRHAFLRNWLEAEQSYLRILDEYGNSATDALRSYAEMLATIGRQEEAIPLLRQVKRLDPLSRDAAYTLAQTLVATGRYEEGLSETERGLLLEGDGGDLLFTLPWFVAFDTGDRFVIADALEESLGEDDPSVLGLRAADSQAALSWVRNYATDPTAPPITRVLAIHFAAVLGEPELALETLILLQQFGLTFRVEIWMDHLSEMRQLPGFRDAARDAGLFDYWRSTGNWADKCRALADAPGEFQCN